MRICLDLDGVICDFRRPGETYADVRPMPGAVDRIRDLRAAGHHVIIQTARHMKTTGGNVGLVIARQGQITLEWLDRNGIEFDEIHFGKPFADVYIDDNAFRFLTWEDVAPDGMNLPVSSEMAAEALS
jgi:capsule biosynthesis phosphatase